MRSRRNFFFPKCEVVEISSSVCDFHPKHGLKQYLQQGVTILNNRNLLGELQQGI